MVLIRHPYALATKADLRTGGLSDHNGEWLKEKGQGSLHFELWRVETAAQLYVS
jgi:hypothetical protein